MGVKSFLEEDFNFYASTGRTVIDVFFFMHAAMYYLADIQKVAMAACVKEQQHARLFSMHDTGVSRAKCPYF